MLYDKIKKNGGEQMKYQYDHDVKRDFIYLLEQKRDFSGVPELSHYLEQYHEEKNQSKKDLIGLCIYKLSISLTDKDLRYFDCDASKNVTESFIKTYHWLSDFQCQNQRSPYTIKYELVNGMQIFRGDTMTSLWIPIKQYLQHKNSICGISMSKWKTYFLNNIDTLEISQEAGRFLQLGHSIGNFIPVPLGFNVGRSNFGRWDSWDLTLEQIYQWYQANTPMIGTSDDAALKLLFSHARRRQYAVSNCQSWLSHFGSWEAFVRENHLQPFVEKNGMPVKFFQGHSLNHPQPSTIAEFDSFFKTVNQCIEERGKQIITHCGRENPRFQP